MKLRTFEPFRFYRSCVNGVVFRCERVKGEKALLHIADMRLFFKGHDRRKVVHKTFEKEWESVPTKEEYPYLLAYYRDLHRDYRSNDSESSMDSAILRRQYYLDPYLADVADEEIIKRIEAIGDNIFRFDLNGEIKLLTGAKLVFWQRKAEEALEELASGRGHLLQDHPEQPGTKAMIIKLNTQKNGGYVNAIPWDTLPKPSAGQLFKFGEAKYLRPALELGRFRISTTSFYGRGDLNSARQDGDEGRTILRPSRTGLEIFLKDASNRTIFGPADRVNRQIAVEIGGDQDFFIWCCSATYEPRLYVDFQANACLVIHDAAEFGRRLNKGLLSMMPTLPGMKGNHVRYYDPFVPDDTLEEMVSTPLSLFLFKDLRYSYQSEYRFIWPVDEKNKEPFLDIEVGSMTDICELLVLSNAST